MLVYGIGYEGREPEQLTSALRTVGVEVLVDVRLTANSRKPGFAKTALRGHLAAADIDYLHLRALGNERENRDGFAHTSGPAAIAARARYRARLTGGSASAVAELLEVVEERTAALLCFERDARRCHREVLVEHLQDLEPRLVAVPLSFP